ncbi:MAG: hypothetical protein ABJL99_12485 [Aliishimia sp.]
MILHPATILRFEIDVSETNTMRLYSIRGGFQITLAQMRDTVCAPHDLWRSGETYVENTAEFCDNPKIAGAAIGYLNKDVSVVRLVPKGYWRFDKICIIADPDVADLRRHPRGHRIMHEAVLFPIAAHSRFAPPYSDPVLGDPNVIDLDAEKIGGTTGYSLQAHQAAITERVERQHFRLNVAFDWPGTLATRMSSGPDGSAICSL